MRITNVPFVGRAEELELVCEALPDGDHGAGRFIGIAGDPGIGKTRLLTEIARIASAEGKRVLWGQIGEDPTAPPFVCWTLILREYARHCTDERLRAELASGAAEVAVILPEICDRLDVAPATRTSAGSQRYSLFDAVARFLLSAARRAPLIILMDNLHAADRSTLWLLENLCQQIAGSPILIVGAYRHAQFDRRSPLKNVMSSISRTPGYQLLSLDGLTLDDVAYLLSTQVGSPVPASFVQAVYEQSGGNPLYVREVASMLSQARSGSGMSRLRYQIDMPVSLRDVINSRLDALPEETIELLGVAAVLGTHFDVTLLSRLAERPPDQVRRALEPAEDAGIISSDAPGRLGFHHVLFREVLYGEHSTARRAKLHRRAGELIESRAGHESPQRLSELAHHYFESAQADDGRRALEYCRAAGDDAARRRAYAEAVAMYEHALQASELCEQADPGLRFELLYHTGQAQYHAGELNAATQTLMKAAIAAYRQGWWERLAEALFAYQLICQQSGFRHIASVPLHRLVLQNLPLEGAEELRARVLVSLAKAYRTAGEPALAASTYREGIDLARATGNPCTLLDCLRKGNWTAGREPSSMRDGLAISREALALARVHGPPDAVLDSITDVVFQLCDLGAIDEAEERMVEMGDLAREQRQPHFTNVLMGFETAIAILRGRWQQALDSAQRSLRQIPLQGVLGLEGRFGFQMFAIVRSQGLLGEVRGLADEILSSREKNNLWLPGQVLLQCELDQHDAAAEALERLGDLSKLPRDDLFLISLVYLAEASAALRSRSRCAELYDLLLPYRGLNATLPATLMLGAVSGYLAMLAVALRRYGEARELYEEALTFNLAMGARPFVARTKVELARLLLATEDQEARVRANELVASAQPIAEELNLDPVRKSIRTLRETSQVDSLTPRELDILKVIGSGLSNQRIAEALHISHSTVTTHIRNIFRKTGATNRTEAAAFARRAGLLE